jgi:hypothetical protein
MKRLLFSFFAICLATAAFAQKSTETYTASRVGTTALAVRGAQGVQIPNEIELGYYFGFHSHQLTGAAEFDMGVGIEGFAQTDIAHPFSGGVTDKFYVGIRYRWESWNAPKWEGTVSAGAWTTGLFYNFPVYPLALGSRASLGYRVNDQLSVGPQVFITPQAKDSEFSIGLMYKLY